MESKGLVSIITPAYNAEKYIGETIESVLSQAYSYWELIIINNNSSDDTESIVKSFKDDRIKYGFEESKGVGFARNKALEQAQGKWICFLDADDILPPNSLLSRVKVFEGNPDLDFVDGKVQYVDENLNPMGKAYEPSFEGQPFDQLLQLNDQCVFGNTWMIKKEEGHSYRFETDMTHSEDLFFYLSIARSGLYSYTTDEVLKYRQHSASSMRNLDGLEKGYLLLLHKVRNQLKVGGSKYSKMKRKIGRIIFLSHLLDGKNPIRAFYSLYKVLMS